METNIDTQALIEVAREAGAAINKVYEDTAQFEQVEYKNDDSPLTIADQKSHDIIFNRLQQMYPDIPVISEEGPAFDLQERKLWHTFWLVDPLDGTKEFLKRNGEFTVNIALIENNHPVFGVIYAPALDLLYYNTNQGAFKLKDHESPEAISTRLHEDNLIAIGSRSHSGNEDENFLKNYKIAENKSIGSSLKFCLVAEGGADIYFRGKPTMEWDTAAGHAILEAAGGKVKNLHYNKEALKNDKFLCVSDQKLLPEVF